MRFPLLFHEPAISFLGIEQLPPSVKPEKPLLLLLALPLLPPPVSHLWVCHVGVDRGPDRRMIRTTEDQRPCHYRNIFKDLKRTIICRSITISYKECRYNLWTNFRCCSISIKIQYLLSDFGQSAEMHEVTSVGTGHPLDLLHVRHLPTDQVGEHSDRHVGFKRLVGIVPPVVSFEDLLVVVRDAVRYQHDRLVAPGPFPLGSIALEKLERGGQGQREIRDLLRIEIQDRSFQFPHVRQVGLDQGVVETRHHLQ